MNVICFGDSNTYGYDPRGYFGGRYDAGSRWVDILAAKTGWTVSNLGENGREIPTSAPDFPDDTDLLIVMLGINDLLQGRSPKQAADRLERFLSSLSLDRSKILLIAPPPMKQSRGTEPLPPDFCRNSNETNSAYTFIPSAVDWVRRKLRGWLPADHPGGGQGDDGHPGGHHPGCAGAG